jgi:hypothetical protein
MKRLILILMVAAVSANAAYKETMDPDGPVKDLRSDYGLVDDGARTDQSAVFQKAIDELAAAGGGRITVPKGTYRLAWVRLKSNIHLLIEKGTVIKPHWPEGTKVVVFMLDPERPRSKRQITPEQDRAFIENVSIRGGGGRFVVDYSGRERNEGEGSRAVLGKMVRNFLIENMDVQDNFSTYCGITLTPTSSRAKDVKEWEVSRATDGLVRNCRIFNASPGYGLTQLHGAQSVHFEDIYAKGGVTLRLETGAVGLQTGVHDITAKNVTCENGRCAVMFGPHSAMNGLVRVEDVVARSCTFAVTIGKGGVKDGQLKIEPDATDGVFAEGSYVRNIHMVFGKKAQVKSHVILSIPEEYYDDLNLRWENKFFEGPSIGAVKDTAEGHYRIRIENVTMEGFKYNADRTVLTGRDARPGKWAHELRKWKAERTGDPTRQARPH